MSGVRYSISVIATPRRTASSQISPTMDAFARAWSIIQPSLRDPSVALSPSLLRILGSISNDGTTILTRLRESITTLTSRYRKIGIAATKNVILRIGNHYKTQCRQILIEFLGQQLVVLHRSQIIFATSTLNVILVVIQWVQSASTLSVLCLIPLQSRQSKTYTTTREPPYS
jgi:hypothetical protein